MKFVHMSMRMIISCKLLSLTKSTTSVDLKTTEYITKMSEDVSDIEQITKTPIKENVKKEKDPKNVAAGKKLAEHNRRAKEALKREMKREAEKATEPEERETGESQGWILEISFTTAISLVCIGLTAINMFMSYKKDTKVMSEPPQVRLPESNRVEPQPSKIPLPKMGMI